MQNKYLPFRLLTLTIFIALLLPKMIQEGMFMDGMLYACVSKNLAHGFGTFWFPKFNLTGFAGLQTFHEHPPLVFGIQSIFFRILGDSFYIEKFYSFLMACIVAWLIMKTWRLSFEEDNNLKNLEWLPVLFWIIMPVIYFSFQNNLMENTMSVFSLLAVYFAIKGLQSGRQIFFNLFLSGLFTFLASFSKGIPGLFTVGVAGIWWLVKRDISFRQIAVYTLILLLVPAFIYGFLILINHNAYLSLENYVVRRLFERIGHAHTVGSRFHVLEKIVTETAPALIITLLVSIAGGLKKLKQPDRKYIKTNIYFFLLTGLSGSVPLMLTKVQKSFYFVHALPFIAIGLAIIAAPALSDWIHKIKINKGFKIFRILSFLALISVLVYSGMQIGKVERDRELISDVRTLGNNLPVGSVIGVSPTLYTNWSLQMYLERYYHITIEKTDPGFQYYLVNKGSKLDVDKHCKKSGLSMNFYALYECN